MRRNFLILTFVLLLTTICFGFQTNFTAEKFPLNSGKAKKSSVETKPAVLVELFTSEGCPTCPPADLLLEMLGKEQPNENAEIITLALHVDYWDRADWKDKYSSPIFSRRQDIYSQVFRTGEVYTPQMVVDGQTYFGGSNAEKAHKAINKNAKNEKANIEISFEKDKFNVEISKIPAHERSTVYLAIAEDELEASGMRGKNAKHYSVVRELKSLGMLMPDQNTFKAIKFIQFQSDWKKENLKFVVFVQENGSRKVIGVNKFEFE